MKAKIYAALANNAGVAAIVGGRIYPVILPQRATFPAVTYSGVSGGDINSLSGATGAKRARVQVDARATSFKVAEQLRKAVQAALKGAETIKAIVINEYDTFEDVEDGVYLAITDFSIFDKGE